MINSPYLTSLIQIHKPSEDYSEDSISAKDEMAVDVPKHSEPTQAAGPQEEKQDAPAEFFEAKPAKTKSHYERTLSGGLQSPRAEVPKIAILQRINSKKAAQSYQLGNQLSLKWTTGAGPRIGCVADYPAELRLQALEFVNLSPRTPPTPASPWTFKGLTVSPRLPATPISNSWVV